MHSTSPHKCLDACACVSSPSLVLQLHPVIPSRPFELPFQRDSTRECPFQAPPIKRTSQPKPPLLLPKSDPQRMLCLKPSILCGKCCTSVGSFRWKRRRGAASSRWRTRTCALPRASSCTWKRFSERETSLAPAFQRQSVRGGIWVRASPTMSETWTTIESDPGASWRWPSMPRRNRRHAPLRCWNEMKKGEGCERRRGDGRRSD